MLRAAARSRWRRRKGTTISAARSASFSIVHSRTPAKNPLPIKLLMIGETNLTPTMCPWWESNPHDPFGSSDFKSEASAVPPHGLRGSDIIRDWPIGVKLRLFVLYGASARRLLARLHWAEGFETLCVEGGNRALEMLKFARADLNPAGPWHARHGWAGVPQSFAAASHLGRSAVIVVTGRPEEHESLDQVWKLGVKDRFVKTTYTLSRWFTSIRRHAAA